MRKKLSHAHPYTVGRESEGNYMPGLGYTVSDDSSWKTLSTTPEDFLGLAADVEQAISALGNARRAVRELPVSKLV